VPVSSKPSYTGVERLSRQQIAAYRRMTGEQRLLLSLDMTQAMWRIAADAIRNGTPGISEQDVRARIRERRTWANSRAR
jgi:hypothetical protein